MSYKKRLKKIILRHGLMLSLVFVSVLAGFWMPVFWLIGLLGLLAFTLRYQSHIGALKHWLKHRTSWYPPEVTGASGSLFELLYQLMRRVRKRHKRLLEVIRRFRLSLNVIPEAALLLGPEGQILWFNKAACEMLGVDLRQDRGQRLFNIWRDPELIAYEQAGDFKKSVIAQAPYRSNRLLKVQLTPYGNQTIVTVRDVSEEVKLERMKRDFVANVSHELRTPLTVLLGYLETLMASESRDEVEQQALTHMSAQAKRMHHLVDDLLNLARLEQGDMRTADRVDVAALLASLVKEATRISDGNHEILLDVEQGLCVRGNVRELQSLFGNLIQNAVRYTPKGGKIIIRWSQNCHNRQAEFSVEDTGIGIAAHHIERLTERFYRVDVGRSRAIGGTGLGLAIVKHILEHYQTDLKIHSELGSGSVFSCHFKQQYLMK